MNNIHKVLVAGGLLAATTAIMKELFGATFTEARRS